MSNAQFFLPFLIDFPIISIKDFYFSIFAVTKDQPISLLGIKVLMTVATIAVPVTEGVAFYRDHYPMRPEWKREK